MRMPRAQRNAHKTRIYQRYQGLLQALKEKDPIEVLRAEEVPFEEIPLHVGDTDEGMVKDIMLYRLQKGA